MKNLIINQSDLIGGAARAAYRLHHALLNNASDSSMWVNETFSDDWTVTKPNLFIEKLSVKIRPHIGSMIASLQKTPNKILHSPAIIPSNYPTKINNSNADIVNLHWINGEMLSISDIPKINKPLVWTLHDMWAFSGAEHYSADTRWMDGYKNESRIDGESGFNLNHWVWRRKMNNWKQPIPIITPSSWMAEMVGKSALMHEWPVYTIPNPINTNIWSPVEKLLARQLLNLPTDVQLIAFGSYGANSAPIKGFDLLVKSLANLKNKSINFELVVLGQLRPQRPLDLGVPIHYLGHLHDDIGLRLAYSASDIVAIPSRIDNLPNMGLEAHSCGTPIVAFNTCGLPEIIKHKETGYLANAFDPLDFSEGMNWILSDLMRLKILGKQARLRAKELWDENVIAKQYATVYRQVLEEFKR